MANSTTIQVILDGSRNVVVKAEGVLDTSDLSSVTLLDPANLQGIDNTGTVKASKLRVERITYNVEDTLSVNLLWNANTPVRIEELTGRGKMEFHQFGGLVDNGGAGVDGKINIATEGWASGKVLSYAVVVECTKVQ